MQRVKIITATSIEYDIITNMFKTDMEADLDYYADLYQPQEKSVEVGPQADSTKDNEKHTTFLHEVKQKAISLGLDQEKADQLTAFVQQQLEVSPLLSAHKETTLGEIKEKNTPKDIEPLILSAPIYVYGKAVQSDPINFAQPDFAVLRPYKDSGNQKIFGSEDLQSSDFANAEVGSLLVQMNFFEDKMFLTIFRRSSHSLDLQAAARQNFIQLMAIEIGTASDYIGLIKKGYNPLINSQNVQFQFSSNQPENISYEIPFAYSSEYPQNIWQKFSDLSKIAPLIYALSENIMAAQRDHNTNLIIGDNPLTGQPFTLEEKLLIVHAVHFIISRKKDQFGIRFSTQLLNLTSFGTINFLSLQEASSRNISPYLGYTFANPIFIDKLSPNEPDTQWLIEEGNALKALYEQAQEKKN